MISRNGWIFQKNDKKAKDLLLKNVESNLDFKSLLPERRKQKNQGDLKFNFQFIKYMFYKLKWK